MRSSGQDPGDDPFEEPQVGCDFVCRKGVEESRCPRAVERTHPFQGMLDGAMQRGELWCVPHSYRILEHQRVVLQEAAAEIMNRSQREAQAVAMAQRLEAQERALVEARSEAVEARQAEENERMRIVAQLQERERQIQEGLYGERETLAQGLLQERQRFQREQDEVQRENAERFMQMRKQYESMVADRERVVTLAGDLERRSEVDRARAEAAVQQLERSVAAERQRAQEMAALVEQARRELQETRERAARAEQAAATAPSTPPAVSAEDVALAVRTAVASAMPAQSPALAVSSEDVARAVSATVLSAVQAQLAQAQQEARRSAESFDRRFTQLERFVEEVRSRRTS